MRNKVLFIILSLFLFTGCSQADKARVQLQDNADNFTIMRKVTVVNTRTDNIILETYGYISIKTDSDGDLNIIGKLKDGTKYINYIHLNDNTTYVVEQMLDEPEEEYQLVIRPGGNHPSTESN